MFGVIVGLGNPGARYDQTRHNIGFRAIDVAADRFRGARVSPSDWREKFGALVFESVVAGERRLFVKPLSFMNLSGEPLQQLLNFYKLAADEVVVLHDEIDLPFGTLRLKQGGSEAGHNGLRSIASCIGTREFVRVRLGVGKPGPEWKSPMADWVLSKFTADEEKLMPSFLDNTAKAVALLCESGLKEAQNRYNNIVL